jgi:hypothetical protein
MEKNEDHEPATTGPEQPKSFKIKVVRIPEDHGWNQRNETSPRTNPNLSRHEIEVDAPSNTKIQ